MTADHNGGTRADHSASAGAGQDRRSAVVDRAQLAALRQLRRVFGVDQIRIATPTPTPTPAPSAPSGALSYRGWPLTGTIEQLHAAVDGLRAETVAGSVERSVPASAADIGRPIRSAAQQLPLTGEPARTLRLLVCGDRGWTDQTLLASTLNHVVADHGVQDAHVVLVEGEARGADQLAAAYAHACGWQVLAYPAEWDRYGRSAGPRRNQRMLHDGRPDLVVAFHDDLNASRGTADMLRRARAAGVRVVHVAHRHRTRSTDARTGSTQAAGPRTRPTHPTRARTQEPGEVAR